MGYPWVLVTIGDFVLVTWRSHCANDLSLASTRREEIGQTGFSSPLGCDMGAILEESGSLMDWNQWTGYIFFSFFYLWRSDLWHLRMETYGHQFKISFPELTGIRMCHGLAMLNLPLVFSICYHKYCMFTYHCRVDFSGSSKWSPPAEGHWKIEWKVI